MSGVDVVGVVPKGDSMSLSGSSDEPGPAFTNLLHLPPELRNLVWERVHGTDQPTLRTVCRLLKWDMEQVLGLKVIINENAEAIQNNIVWLQDVIVRSLELVYIGLKVSYHDIQLKNPFMLHRLVLAIHQSDFNDPLNVDNLSRILNSCDRLQDLTIAICMGTITNMHFDSILSETMQCLGTKAYLKQFKLLATKHQMTGNRSNCDDNWALSGRGFRVMPDPTYQPNVHFPMKLQTIDLSIPILSRREFLDWNAFLNTQDQLETAYLKVGLVSWHFYRTALQNSASTLRTLLLFLAVSEIDVYRDEDLSLEYEGNVVTYNGPANDVEDEHSEAFDCSILSETRLNVLGLLGSGSDSPNSASSKIIPTTNFSTLQLSTIKALFLASVHLTTDDLTKIFMEGVSLRVIEMSNWTLLSERHNVSFCLRQSLQVWILISVVLQARPFAKFTLMEQALTGHRMSDIIATVLEMVSFYNKVMFGEGVIELMD